MNLVKVITDQLSGETLGKLSGLLGTDSETVGTAASAAVPALLSGLSGLASNADGAKKLTSVLGGLDASSIGNFANMLGGNTSSMLQNGGGLLGSLFGDGMISTAANAISRFSGLNAGAAKTLLSYLMPLVLGKVVGQWKTQGGTPAALTSLFAEQKRNISDAVPAGFSLGEIPGVGVAREAVRTASDTARRTAETAGRAAPSMASWLLPLAAVLVVGFLLWYFLKPRPATVPAVAQKTATEGERVTAMKPALPDMPSMPNASQLSGDLTGLFKSVTETFAGIKDAASAEAAAPKLEELSAKIDAMKKALGTLPEAGRTTLQRVIDDQLSPIKEQAQRTLNVPGLSDRVKAIISQVLQKLEDWHLVERTN